MDYCIDVLHVSYQDKTNLHYRGWRQLSESSNIIFFSLIQTLGLWSPNKFIFSVSKFAFCVYSLSVKSANGKHIFTKNVSFITNLVSDTPQTTLVVVTVISLSSLDLVIKHFSQIYQQFAAKVWARYFLL